LAGVEVAIVPLPPELRVVGSVGGEGGGRPVRWLPQVG
jgi:hypothetical protein